MLEGSLWRTELPISEPPQAYKDTAAAIMMRDGLRIAAAELGLSQRTIAKQLGYKQSVVLSHMALGRVPIPIDRVQDISSVLMLDKKAFLLAVLEQRYPNIEWNSVFYGKIELSARVDALLELELIANCPLDKIEEPQKRVMREVAADRNAQTRWLSVHELSAIALLRELRPGMPNEGLSHSDRTRIRDALRSACP